VSPRSDYWVAAVDETYAWTIPARFRPFIKAIGTYYLYDRNLAIHLCSTSPSTEAWEVDYFVVFEPETSDSTRQSIYEWVETHIDRSEPVTYFSRDVLHGIPERFQEHYGPGPFGIDKYHQVQSIIEYYHEGGIGAKLELEDAS